MTIVQLLIIYAKNCQKVPNDGEISTKKGSTLSENQINRIISRKKISNCSSYAKNCQKVPNDGEISTKKGSTLSENLKNRIIPRKKIPLI